jgi:tryptophanyl-tRNA synthetase
VAVLREPQISRHIGIRVAATSGVKMSKSSVNLIINILEVEKQDSVGWGKTEVLFTFKKKFGV